MTRAFKPDIKKINEIIILPRFRTNCTLGMEHQWVFELKTQLGGLLPAKHIELIKLCTGRRPANSKSSFDKLYEECKQALLEVFGAKALYRYPDPQEYVLKDINYTVSLVKQVRKDAMKEQDEKPVAEQAKEEEKVASKKTRSKKKSAGKKAVSKKKSAGKKAVSKKKSAGKKKAPGEKRQRSNDGKIRAGDKGVLGVVGGQKNWDAFDKLLDKTFKATDQEVSGTAKKAAIEMMKKYSGKKAKLSTLVEDTSRGTAYMIVNTKTVVLA